MSDNELIKRILNLNGFDMNALDVDKIEWVPMAEYRVSSVEKPMLLVENLQVCIGVYAYCDSFAFACHINPYVMHNNEFVCDENNEPLYSKRIDDLFKIIVEKEEEIKTPIHIGIMLGFNPLEKTYIQYEKLKEQINNLIATLKYYNINMILLDMQYEPFFIVDSTKKCIITPSKKEKTQK